MLYVIACTIYCAALLFIVFMLVKHEIIRKNRLIISDAIHRYRMNVIAKHDFKNSFEPKYDVAFEDMEPYDKTFWRLWDWSYKRILPKDKFAIIEPYIEHS